MIIIIILIKIIADPFDRRRLTITVCGTCPAHIWPAAGLEDFFCFCSLILTGRLVLSSLVLPPLVLFPPWPRLSESFWASSRPLGLQGLSWAPPLRGDALMGRPKWSWGGSWVAPGPSEVALAATRLEDPTSAQPRGR